MAKLCGWMETPVSVAVPDEPAEVLSQGSQGVLIILGIVHHGTSATTHCLLAVRRKDGSMAQTRPLFELAHREHGSGKRSAASHLNCSMLSI